MIRTRTIFIMIGMLVGCFASAMEDPETTKEINGMVSFFYKAWSNGKWVASAACQHNELALIGATLGLWLKLYSLEHSGKKEVPRVTNTINITLNLSKQELPNTTQDQAERDFEYTKNSAQQVQPADSISPDLDTLLKVLNKKPEPEPEPIIVYDYSKPSRYWFRASREGLEVADVGRFFGWNSKTTSYMGICRKDDNEREYTPFVRYFEVAGAHVDAHEALDYVGKHFAKMRSENTSNDTVGTQVTAASASKANSAALDSARRLLEGGMAIYLTNAKSSAMEPEAILTCRALDVASRFAKERVASDNFLINDAFDSVQEAAQRQPYVVLAKHKAAGYKDVQRDPEQSSSFIAMQAVYDTGINAGGRFVVKQAKHALTATDKGTELVLWTNENVPEWGQNVAEEVASAGVTWAAIKAGESLGGSCVVS